MSELRRIEAPGAPPAIGPYCHAVSAQGLLFCSGQIGLDPQSGKLVEGGVVEQARRCMANLAAVCAAAGTSLERAVRVGIHLTDMADFPAVNELYGSLIGAEPPARVTVAVAALPAGASVEIDAIVALD